MVNVPTPGQRMATAATAAIGAAMDEARSQVARPTAGLTDAPTSEGDPVLPPPDRAHPHDGMGPSGPLLDRG